MVAEHVDADGAGSVLLRDAVARALAAVRDVSLRVDGLRGRGRLGGAVAIAALPQVDSLVAVVGMMHASLIAIASADAAAEDLGGERDFTSYRARSTRQGRGRAQSEGNVARALEDVPGLRDAVTDGGVTLGHVNVVAEALGRADESTREQLTREADEIVEAARELPVPELQRKLAARGAAIAADAADRSYEGARARRYLRLTARSGGVELAGFLDVVAGATLRAAIDAVTPAPSADDVRSGQQRSADGLVSLADRALSFGLDKAGAQLRPHLSVLVREDTWFLLMHRRRLQAQGCGTAGRVTSDAFGRSGLEAEPPLAELLDGTLLPFAALDVLTCDAFVQRVVLDPVGDPMDVGREQRTWAAAPRRAVLVRDRHCQWPGCGMRASWCEVHHIRFWSDEGPTDKDNGITLCGNHHQLVHLRKVRITPVPGGFDFVEKSGTPIGSSTRLHDELLVPRPRDLGSGGGGGGGGGPGGGGGGSGGGGPGSGGDGEARAGAPGDAPSDETVLPEGCPALFW